MTATTRRLVGSWLVGMIIGTGVVAATSPLFVRSYLPLHADETRGVWTLPPGQWYRWRSEGYADTYIGPLGMPGKREIPARRRDVLRIALWGDSQAEGVCVGDRDKLFAQIERISGGRLDVFPLARSGEDAADWLTQMPAVEPALDLDAHVILVVDLQDLLTATQAPLPRPSESDVASAHASIAAKAPAFVIQAARHLLREADEATTRHLRFSVGPVRQPPPTENPSTSQSLSARSETWRREMQAIRDATRLPVYILYAPVSPQIVGGRVIFPTVPEHELRSMKSAAETAGIAVLDVGSELVQSARSGRWPHGFNNGYIGSGHLNVIGNEVVASSLTPYVALMGELSQDAKEGN